MGQGFAQRFRDPCIKRRLRLGPARETTMRVTATSGPVTKKEVSAVSAVRE
jgi:hypothetical protein